MNPLNLLSVLFGSFKSQERSVIVSGATAFLTRENTRVSGPATADAIATTANTIADIVLAEECALLNALTAKTAAAPAAKTSAAPAAAPIATPPVSK